MGIRIIYDDDDGYKIDQKVSIREMLRDNGLEASCGVRTPIGDEFSNSHEEDVKLSRKSGTILLLSIILVPGGRFALAFEM